MSKPLELYFFPLGSRTLSLSYPASKGYDIWLLQRWLNRARSLQPAWSWPQVLEDGRLSGRLLLSLRQLAKHLMVWQPWQVCDMTYLCFGQLSGRFLPTQVAFGTRALIPGDEGHDVWVLQNRLVGANRRLAIILGRPADGIYDQRTARMVRAFQRDSQPAFPGLRVTGHVLADSFVAVWDRTIIGGRELHVGARGLDVLYLQELLQGMGYAVELTGIFDQVMQTALARWQKDNGLPITGRFAAVDCWRLGLERGY
ncbi:MAG: peptidoglycan-binding protein [Firmicutes bacterium]|jgi:peptidoglycan hydrolase-like protein with peptidoglycan-binding domain|nr:peptidoglycan-binding protein [Bacillota bacterium]